MPLTLAGAAKLHRDLQSHLGAYSNLGWFAGSALVSLGDTLLLRDGSGLADSGRGVPNAPETRHRIACVTKLFTSALALKMQDEGLLNLTDPIGKLLPASSGLMPRRYAAVTLEQLLANVSGIPSFTDMPEYSTTESYVPASMAQTSLDSQPLFAAGERFAYSNTDYCLAALILERVSGQSYPTLLRQRLLTPLGLEDTGMAIGLQRAAHGGMATGYSVSGEGTVLAARYGMSATFGSGCLYSTVDDLRRWATALMRGEVLSEGALESMLRPRSAVDYLGGHYGLGVVIRGLGSATGPDYSNGGYICGVRAELHFRQSAADGLLVVAILSNNDACPAQTISNELADIALGASVPARPTRPSAAAVPQTLLDSAAGTYESAFAGVRHVRAETGRLLTDAFHGQRARSEWLELVPVEVAPKALRCRFTGMAGGISFTLNDIGEAEAMTLQWDGYEIPAGTRSH